MIDWKTETICYFWFAYVFGEKQTGHIVKIGTTSNIRSRSSGIATGCPYDCWKVYGFWMPYFQGEELERILHDRFAEFRMRGEWFCIPTLEWWEFEKSLPVAFHGAKMPMLYCNGDVNGQGLYVPTEWPPGHPNFSEAA